MKRNILRTAAALIAAVLLYPCHAWGLSARSAIVVDGQTGRVICEKNADQQSLIASTTKIMTALIVCEQCNVLDRMTIPKEAVGVEGSSMYLQEGEVLTIQELLYGMMLSSGNDAATALAIYCGGTLEGFAQMMNDKARILGMHNSHFVNPHGLDAQGHYSTARDLALLAEYAMKNAIFAQTVGTKTVRVTNRSLQNHNKLLWTFPEADGVKTGYTKAAGRILVSSATRNGRRVICVTIDDPNDWQDHKVLLEDALCRYSAAQIVQIGDTMGILGVFGGTEEWVTLVAAEDFSYAVAEGERVTYQLSQKDFAYAPVVSGGDAGYAYVCIDGKAVGKVKVRYQKTVEQAMPEKKSFWERLLGGKT